MSVRSSRKEICNRAVHQICPQMFQNDRRAMTGSCRGTISHGLRSIAIFIRMDFISLVALNCRMTWVSEAFGLHPGLVNNLGGRSVKITTASASSRGRTSLNKTQHGYFFFPQSTVSVTNCVWVLPSVRQQKLVQNLCVYWCDLWSMQGACQALWVASSAGHTVPSRSSHRGDGWLSLGTNQDNYSHWSALLTSRDEYIP